jgi:hypothetical protein
MIATLLLMLSSAFAASTNGYVTSVTFYNSSYSTYACEFVLSTTATSTSGVTFTVDDVTGEYSATCVAAMISSYTDDKLYVDYTTSGSRSLVSGVYASTTSGAIYNFYSNSSTGTSSADRCSVLINGSSGLANGYVDDGYAEEDMMCTLLALRHFTNSGSGNYSTSSSELNYYTVKF